MKKLCSQMRQIEKIGKNRKNRNTECNFIHRRHNENFVKLRRKIEESIRYKSEPDGNVDNVTAFSFSKSEHKLLNKNLNSIPTPKVYNQKRTRQRFKQLLQTTKTKSIFQRLN